MVRHRRLALGQGLDEVAHADLTFGSSGQDAEHPEPDRVRQRANPLASSAASVVSRGAARTDAQHSACRVLVATACLLTGHHLHIDIYRYIRDTRCIDQDRCYQEVTMSRVQLALNVSDIDEAVEFYTKLFGTEPAKRQPGYANFAIADPPLKLVLMEDPSARGTGSPVRSTTSASRSRRPTRWQRQRAA